MHSTLEGCMVERIFSLIPFAASRALSTLIPPDVDPVPMRTVSLVFRKDYIHEQLLNVVVDAVKTIIPSGMQEQVIKGERIKL